jgi:putative acetyltransferase
LEIKITRATGSHPDLMELVMLLDSELLKIYGTEIMKYRQYNLTDDIGFFVIAYVDEIAVGCIGLRPYSDTAVEIKRVFVKRSLRGHGIAKRLLLEADLGFGIEIYRTCFRNWQEPTKHNYIA